MDEKVISKTRSGGSCPSSPSQVPSYVRHLVNIASNNKVSLRMIANCFVFWFVVCQHVECSFWYVTCCCKLFGLNEGVRVRVSQPSIYNSCRFSFKYVLIERQELYIEGWITLTLTPSLMISWQHYYNTCQKLDTWRI